MAYRDLAFPELRPGETFPDAKFVEDYLKTYAKHFNLYPSIRFNIKVVNVEWRQSEKMWEVLIEDCKDYSRSMHFFRSVIVANGHFNKPIIPRDIQGLHDDDQFKGVVMHSKTYRRPDVPLFEGKRIIVVGGGSSGNDIANDLLSVAAQIFHSTKDESNVAQSSPLREKINVGRIIRCFGGNRVELSDGQILNDIDVILFATGY